MIVTDRDTALIIVVTIFPIYIVFLWVSYLQKCECQLQNSLQIQRYQLGGCQKVRFQREGGEGEVHIIMQQHHRCVEK